MVECQEKYFDILNIGIKLSVLIRKEIWVILQSNQGLLQRSAKAVPYRITLIFNIILICYIIYPGESSFQNAEIHSRNSKIFRESMIIQYIIKLPVLK